MYENNILLRTGRLCIVEGLDDCYMLLTVPDQNPKIIYLSIYLSYTLTRKRIQTPFNKS